MADFKLSASLQAHEDDVRAVTFARQHAILSASRDATVRAWNLIDSTPPKYDETIASHASSFVNSVIYVPPSADYPDGLIVSGGKDTIIDVRLPGRPPDSDAERLLLGHQGNVCSLDVCLDGKERYIVSGSWDASAMVWDVNKGESTATLEGHEASVWAVLAFDRNTVITGCADKKIRIFRPDGKLVRTIRGGSDVVRALCRLPPSSSPARFASAGNDAVIRLWTLEGAEIAQLHGHENFIYSLAALPNGELVSSSEDRTVRIWRDTQCVQTITHPAISVWSVAACAENGDIVSGASDRIVRVFSRSADRQADAQSIRAFEDSVKASSIPQQQMGDINKEKLPGPEFLTQKSGTKEGQVQMIREDNGNISAYQWSTAAQQWISVGTVVDAAGSTGRKQEHLGQDYDYVFDVDIAEGKPPLKLPFNISQNPYEVAQKFIADNELPITYLDQVANFILTNTQGATLGQAGAEPSQPSSRAGADPWGQESRYRPGEAAPSPAAAPPRPKVIPQNTYLTIATANFPVIRKKIEELNSQLVSSGRKDLSFSPGDLTTLAAALQDLERALSPSTSTSTSTTITISPSSTTSTTLPTALDFAIKISTQWPSASRIPGLDLYRLLAAATPTITTRTDPLSTLQTAGALPTNNPSSEAPNANATMLAIRLLANLFAHAPGRAYALERAPAIRDVVGQCVARFGAGNRNVLIAVMTLYINYGVALSSTSTSPSPSPSPSSSSPMDTAAPTARLLVEDVVGLLADDKVVDSEVQYRALVALGTLLVGPGVGVDAEGKTRVRAVLGRVEKGAKEPRIKGVVEEVRGVL